MTEFWVASGHHLTQRDAAGMLAVTDELLLAYLARPEVLPPSEACDAERALHARLRADPRAPAGPAEIAAMADPDARENWGHLLAFRDLLAGAGTVEAAYLKLVRERLFAPPLFVSHMLQLILRNALDGCDDPFTLRAAELLFRPQASSIRDGALLLADLELLEEIEAERAQAPLVAMLNPDPLAEVDVMTPANAWTWWSRSDAHSMALNYGAETRSREGLAAAIAALLRHLLQLDVLVEPFSAVADIDMRWYVGLDADGTRIGDALWRGQTPSQALAERLVGLFRLTFLRPSQADPRLAGAPVWLIMALGADGRLRLKPQNLIVGLPLSERADAA
jgi:hypothetical protein